MVNVDGNSPGFQTSKRSAKCITWTLAVLA